MSTRAPHNPYIAGKALADEQSFFGRAAILRAVETDMADPQRNAVVLFGQRRIGKTSILLQLQRRLAAPRFQPVVFDLQDRARQPLGRLLADLAAAIAEELELDACDPASFDDRGTFFQRTFLPRIYEALAPGQRPVLLFDEFDVLDVAAEESIPPDSAARAFFPYLRELLRGEPRLGFVFVLGRRISDLSSDVWATFKSARSLRVSVLDEADALALVQSAERQGSLRFAPGAAEAVVALTAGHPFLTQLVCQIVWDEAHGRAHEGGEPPLVTPEHVEHAAARALDDGGNIFVWIWNGLPPAERIIAAAIAEATAVRPEIDGAALGEILQAQGVRILVRELSLAPDTLVEWELLRRAPGGGGYRFLVELLRRWVVANRPLAQARDEIDRLNPLADTLYRAAEWYLRQGDLRRAQTQLTEALLVNPNHLKARLLLGQLLTEQGQLERAVAELSEAYRYDSDEARLPLVRALLALGEERERSGADAEALGAYDRALAISPREKVARDRRAALLTSLGDRHLADEEFDAAERAFQAAGATDRLELLAQRRVSAAARAEREADAARLYQAAVAAQERQDWPSAQRLFAALVGMWPDYADVADRLSDVVRQKRRSGTTPPEGVPTVPPESDAPPEQAGATTLRREEERRSRREARDSGALLASSAGRIVMIVALALLALLVLVVNLPWLNWIFLAAMLALGLALLWRSQGQG